MVSVSPYQVLSRLFYSLSIRFSSWSLLVSTSKPWAHLLHDKETHELHSIFARHIWVDSMRYQVHTLNFSQFDRAILVSILFVCPIGALIFGLSSISFAQFCCQFRWLCHSYLSAGPTSQKLSSLYHHQSSRSLVTIFLPSISFDAILRQCSLSVPL